MDSTKALDFALPALAVLEAIITAKASKGNYVGQTGMELIKARDEQRRYSDQLKEKAVERAAQAKRMDADDKRQDRSLKLQEETAKSNQALQKLASGREEAEFLSKEDKSHRDLIEREKAISRMLGKEGTAPTVDEATNTVTMGEKGKPGLPDLSPLDKEKIQLDPAKFAFEKNALADFIAKWDHQVANPKPTTPKPSPTPNPPNPRLLPAGTVEDLGAIQEAVTMLDKMAKSAGKLKHDLGPLNKVRTINPMDTEIQNLQQYIATTKQVIGKGLEGGVLRKEDEFKYEKIIPKISDTPEVRNQKKVQLRDMLVNKYKTQLKAQGDAGYSTGNLPSEINPEKGPEQESYTPAIEALRVKAVNGDKEAIRYLDSKGIVY